MLLNRIILQCKKILLSVLTFKMSRLRTHKCARFTCTRLQQIFFLNNSYDILVQPIKHCILLMQIFAETKQWTWLIYKLYCITFITYDWRMIIKIYLDYTAIEIKTSKLLYNYFMGVGVLSFHTTLTVKIYRNNLRAILTQISKQ